MTDDAHTDPPGVRAVKDITFGSVRSHLFEILTIVTPT